MNSSKRIFALLLFVSILMFSILTVTAATISEQQTYTTDAKDNSIQIEAKYKKVSTNKITFNANGGKINSKNTVSINVNKGSNIKKFPATPKRTGYTFKGWYTKKTGGTKINKNTKPLKSISYYAQWTKKPSTSTNSKIVGHWEFYTYYNNEYYSYDYIFYNNGKFLYYHKDDAVFAGFVTSTKGKYKISNGKISFTNILYQSETHYPDTVFEYNFGKDTVGEYLFIPSFKYDQPYVDISWGVKFRKV